MGRTVLVVKDSTKGKVHVPSNYHPITCLPVMWKLLTGVIAEAIYQHEMTMRCYHGNRQAVQKEEEQQLCIDKGIMKDCKRRKTNPA